MDLNKAEEFENLLIEKFKTNSLFKKIERLEKSELGKVLLQRRYLSYCFTPVYDLAIDALSERESKKITRRVLREEYPGMDGNSMSHREDLFEDLLAFGFTREEIVNSYPSKETMVNIQDTFSYLREISTEEYYDICLLIFLRFWGEVLVSLEYEQYWRALKSIFASSDNYKSKFYKVHLEHDAKRTPLNKLLNTALTHSDKMSLHLVHLIKKCDDFKIEKFQYIEKKIFTIKANFYKQFKF